MKFFVKKTSFLFFLVSLAAIFSFFLWAILFSFSPQLPSKERPILFYSNQCRNDLRLLFLQGIHHAQHSLFLVTFGLNDLSIVEALETKAKEKLTLQVFYDRRASPNILLSNHQAYALEPQGLVHQKILIQDQKLIFLGSANMTKTSFAADENMIVGFYSPELAQFLLQKAPFFSGSFTAMIQNQLVELFLLPDIDQIAFRSLQKVLQGAKNSIFVAMFAFTHPLLVDELILAKQRGVDVTVAISSQMALGASKKAIEKMQEANIKLVLSPSNSGLFHHKFAKIDENILIAGSTNWTRAAFAKNHDCFFILHDLTFSQRIFLKKLTSTIKKNGSLTSTCTNLPPLLPSDKKH